MFFRSLRTLLAAGAALLTLVPALIANAQSTEGVPADVQRLLAIVSTVDDAVSNGDWATARSGWTDFDNLWSDVEDGFRAVSRDNYRAIEAHQSTIHGLVGQESPDVDRIRSEISAIRELISWFGG